MSSADIQIFVGQSTTYVDVDEAEPPPLGTQTFNPPKRIDLTAPLEKSPSGIAEAVIASERPLFDHFQPPQDITLRVPNDSRLAKSNSSTTDDISETISSFDPLHDATHTTDSDSDSVSSTNSEISAASLRSAPYSDNFTFSSVETYSDRSSASQRHISSPIQEESQLSTPKHFQTESMTTAEQFTGLVTHIEDDDTDDSSEEATADIPDLNAPRAGSGSQIPINARYGETMPQGAFFNLHRSINSGSSSTSSAEISSKGKHRYEEVTPGNTELEQAIAVKRGSSSHKLLAQEPSSPRRIDTPTLQTLEPVMIRKIPLWFYLAMITCISLIGFGSYAAYDAVAAIQDRLMADLSLSTTQFGLLYSVYAFPNIILVIFGGKFVDKFGAHTMGLITAGLVAFGSILVAIAPSLSLSIRAKFAIMLIGRFIFGVGAESSYVVQNSMCVKWFLGDWLATAMSITVTWTRLGSICSFVFAPKIVASGHYVRALWAAAATCVLSFLSVFGYIGLRAYAKRHLLITTFDQNSLELELSEDHPHHYRYNNTQAVVESDSLETSQLDTEFEFSNEDSIQLDETDLESSPHGEMHHLPIPNGSLKRIWSELKITWIEIKGFSSLFWGACALGALTYGISLGFRAVASDALATRYSLTPDSAGLVMATIDITSVFASPLIGYLIDWTLKLGWFTLAGNVIGALSTMLFLPRTTPIPGVVFLGISSTIVPAAIYPAVSFMTKPSIEGLAFGVTSAVINFINLLMNPVTGYALEKFGWIAMSLVLTFFSVIGIAISLWWIYRDSKNEVPVLNKLRNWTAEKRWLKQHIPFLFA